MRRSTPTKWWMFGLLTLASAWWTFAGGSQLAARYDAAAPKPVETDMHEFMEYMFQPQYKRLKTAMTTEPADRAGWKPIKGESLALAEACNLLFDRLPEDKADDWKKLSADTREAAAKLYAAAKVRDFKAAKPAYEAMLLRCNACHDQFADGEHQLTP